MVVVEDIVKIRVIKEEYIILRDSYFFLNLF